ncbi:[Pyruvate dehydrogenase (acetyl-transferring)] kinase 2, mitochondrial [Fulvia fulva]|uniref:Protein-serine/threonine kinase n=1 Tax=Passalora fulva TaxID=5499 RepID=A0A9Q8PAM2_PASFU|nr:[Pyruvate dehydrogenase (acetyl-transferring)] kinase 2, mitochondrial [Fulvia fulva]KAK4621898.1 [Pyruvate dehydrogenase (acetyl-transferring)] kinase 2, mitochondrial [Fulvia fulva]KAK4622906.1 [Pyruvate dehydrogenase (acetyl-transferring)] kinase 2, mitochondrial [Fulvia fulva]UJO18949.1 [Pyruvate dehydrogenase (acetyl-transferring)] kinase 2, mitochondrial [Fulvia fulva]WPV15798.1 [Pyruvate dehydrogenase (acetyl-transferring)] kinase 2, mitochondrial [Fulvia fulva]WPV31722.1 [Pyruvate d
MAGPASVGALGRLPSSIRARAYATAAAGLGHADASQRTFPPPWRPSTILDDWIQREARPVSLRQLTFFGRSLTEDRLITSANYARLELPTRIAHRLRNMQTLPYSAVTNQHISHVYELYYQAFERFRKVPEVSTLEDNDKYCEVLKQTLKEHMTVIPRLTMGILEIQDAVPGEECDRFMTHLLRSRISRRVIAEQHLALTETFHSPWHFPDAKKTGGAEDEFVGEIFLKCNAKEIIEKCAATARKLSQQAYGPHVTIPEIVLQGHMNTTFPYIPSHLEYILGELLRNSIQAMVEQRGLKDPPPIEVLVCEAAQHVIIRVSDQGGGVDREVLPYLWSFAKGPRRHNRLENLGKVPRLAATMQEVQVPCSAVDVSSRPQEKRPDASLASLSGRPPDLKLGMGLPMSKIYAEYWAGSLEVHSLEGYGCDAFLQISRLGNRNETLSTRAAMDAV